MLNRRKFLARTGLMGCSLAASPLITPMSFAAAPWETRLVVIILRGGMDGLDVVRPVGDPDYAALRPGILGDGTSLELDGFFALHPALGPLMPLWQAQELGFVQAVSTPYRDKRSHFDGQDLLEAGTDSLGGTVRDGWLNRLLQQMPDVRAQTAYAIGTSELRILNGTAAVANWTPEANLRLSPQMMRLADLVMETDPALHAAFAEAQMLSGAGQGSAQAQHGARPHIKIARFAAEQLRQDSRIAAFSLNGWDTHRAQARTLPRSLNALSETILTLKSDLGPDVWGKTAVVAMTEFGRTARENGTGGTDHGTAGAMILSGGVIRGGRVFGDWPGLSEAALYQRRDLMPTQDVRAPMASILRAVTGLDRGTLSRQVFPGLEAGTGQALLR